MERELGRGGMGTVYLCHDRQIGRHVAMKTIATCDRDNRSAVRLFVREARVQAQLEHPAVVPVYELGRDPSGHIYFTMKRIRGITLRALIDRLRDSDPAATEVYTRRRLLSDFSRVCLAIDYAHRAGVIHRDLKPTNVTLGEYGEVYVLDWGISKAHGSDADLPKREHLIGTPGYMAPEQIRNPDAVGPAADVYALGTGVVAVGRVRDALDRAERQLESYNLHFRQLLPEAEAADL